MKLILPDNTKIELDSKLSTKEKEVVVSDILKDWNNYFETYKQTRRVQTCLDILSNYLTKQKRPKKGDVPDG